MILSLAILETALPAELKTFGSEQPLARSHLRCSLVSSNIISSCSRLTMEEAGKLSPRTVHPPNQLNNGRRTSCAEREGAATSNGIIG
jgi:hypothetical protein